VVGDAEGLIKRGVHLYIEVGEPDFIDEDVEDDEHDEYNTFIVTSILVSGTHVVMQRVVNGEPTGEIMTSKDLSIPEIVSGIKLYARLNPPSTFGGNPGAPAPKKPRAEAQPKPSPAQSGTAVVRFGLQKDLISGLEIKDSALFHSTTVDFSRWITAFAGLTSSSRFKLTLSKDLARMVMVGDATVYRFVIMSVHEAIPLLKPGRKAPGPPPFTVSEYMNIGAFTSALNDDRVHRVVVVLGNFQKKVDAPDLTDEDELTATPPGGYLSVIKMPLPDASLCDAEVPKTKPPAEEAPLKGSGHRGKAPAQPPGQGAGPPKKPDGEGSSRQDEDCSLAGKRQVGAHILADPAYAKLYQSVTMKIADITSQSRMKLWRDMTVLAASLAADKMTQEAWGKLAKLCKFESRLDIIHAQMRELDSARSCVYLWNDPANLATSPDFSTPPKIEGMITWSSKSAEPNSETFERLFGKDKDKDKDKGKGKGKGKASARDDVDEDEDEDEDSSGSNSGSSEPVPIRKRQGKSKKEGVKKKKSKKHKKEEKKKNKGKSKKEKKRKRSRRSSSSSSSSSSSDESEEPRPKKRKNGVKKEEEEGRGGASSSGRGGASSSAAQSAPPWSDSSHTRRLRSHSATVNSPIILDESQ